DRPLYFFSPLLHLKPAAVVLGRISRKEICRVSTPFIMIHAPRQCPKIRLTTKFISIVGRFGLQRHRITKTQNLAILCVETCTINIFFSAHDASQFPVMPIHLTDPLSFPTALES